MVVLLRFLSMRNIGWEEPSVFVPNQMESNWTVRVRLGQGCFWMSNKYWICCLHIFARFHLVLTFSLSFDHLASNHVTAIALLPIGRNYNQTMNEYECVVLFWIGQRPLTFDHLFKLFHRSCVFGIRKNRSILPSYHQEYILKCKRLNKKSRWKYTSNGNALKIGCFTLRVRVRLSHFVFSFVC